MERLTLTQNADLVVTYWHYDGAAGKGEYRTRSVECLDAYVMHASPCFLDEGLLLRDVFRFMSKHLEFLSVYLGAECQWVVEEGELVPLDDVFGSDDNESVME